jgi:CrcB protein
MSALDRRELGAIFAGGAIGALARVWLSQRFTQGDTSWPWTIFVINVSGSFALAYLATRLQERLPLSTYRRPALGTGFCGAYTTFSTMQVEIVKMVVAGDLGLAAGYGFASLAAGLAAIWLASAIVRRARLA